MILGMSLSAFTQFHVGLSLIGIGSGIVVILGLLNAKHWPGMTAVFLATSVLTSATGFLFPIPFDAAYVVGIVSLVLLAVAIFALYGKHLEHSWRGVYSATAVAALYLNCFVLVVQGFGKIPFLHAFAPTGKEPAFAAAQGALLVLFVALGITAVKKFRVGQRDGIRLRVPG